MALAYVQQQQALLANASAVVKAPAQELPAKISQIMDNVRLLERELERLKSKLAASQGDDLLAQAVDIAGIKVLAARLDGVDAKALRELADNIKDKLGQCALLLAVADGDKVSLLAAVSKGLTSRIQAGDLVNFVATQVGGKGGGRPDMAMAGGTDAGKLPQALASVAAYVQQQLN
jgi:alanyl-tRNA synthetase